MGIRELLTMETYMKRRKQPWDQIRYQHRCILSIGTIRPHPFLPQELCTCPLCCQEEASHLTIVFLPVFCSRLHISTKWASRVVQRVKNLSSMQETWDQSLGQEDPLEKGMTTHSGILAWENPWTEEPGRLRFMSYKEWDTTERLSTLLHKVTGLTQEPRLYDLKSHMQWKWTHLEKRFGGLGRSSLWTITCHNRLYDSTEISHSWHWTLRPRQHLPEPGMWTFHRKPGAWLVCLLNCSFQVLHSLHMGLKSPQINKHGLGTPRTLSIVPQQWWCRYKILLPGNQHPTHPRPCLPSQRDC